MTMSDTSHRVFFSQPHLAEIRRSQQAGFGQGLGFDQEKDKLEIPDMSDS